MPKTNIVKSSLFIKDLKKVKDASIHKQVKKCIQLLESDPHHPSLHNKHIVCKDANNLYSVRVNKNYRILYLLWEDEIELHRLLDHDKYERLIKNC